MSAKEPKWYRDEQTRKEGAFDAKKEARADRDAKTWADYRLRQFMLTVDAAKPNTEFVPVPIGTARLLSRLIPLVLANKRPAFSLNVSNEAKQNSAQLLEAQQCLELRMIGFSVMQVAELMGMSGDTNDDDQAMPESIKDRVERAQATAKEFWAPFIRRQSKAMKRLPNETQEVFEGRLSEQSIAIGSATREEAEAEDHAGFWERYLDAVDLGSIEPTADDVEMLRHRDSALSLLTDLPDYRHLSRYGEISRFDFFDEQKHGQALSRNHARVISAMLHDDEEDQTSRSVPGETFNLETKDIEKLNRVLERKRERERISAAAIKHIATGVPLSENPFSFEAWNLTEQGKEFSNDESRAHRLAREAGTTVGGPRPKE